MSSSLPNTPDLANAHPEQEIEAYSPPAWERSLGWAYLVALVIGALLLLRLPMISSAYTITLTLTVLLVIALSSSWNWLSGFGGYTSFGTAGFFGIGSYTYALLLHYEKMGWIPAVLVAGALTGVIGFLIGIPTLRLRGPYFAIAMLAFTELARVIVLSWDELTLGGQGVFLRFPRKERLEDGMSFWEEFGVAFNNNQTYYAMLALAVLAMIWSYIVGTSRWGLKLLSIRDDEVAAESMGIRTTYVKVTTFAGSAIFPGVAGAIYARHIGYIDPPTVFAIIWSIRAITTTIFGGRGTILGPIIGAVILTLVSEEVWAQDPNLYQIIYGAIIILVMLFMPGGLISLLQGRNFLPRSRRI
jgi:branched-chain amino acid transport system permease protein